MSGTTALLLVDCQEDYFARGGLEPPRQHLVDSIAKALNVARDAGWPVMHVRTRVSADGSDAMPHRRGSPEAVQGTPGAQPPPELREAEGEAVFHKRFFSAFDADGLEDALHQEHVQQIHVAGVHSHACIQATVLDAYARGFEVVIDEDLVGSYDPAHGAQALDWLDGRAATVLRKTMTAAAWEHRNPCNWDEVLGEIELMSPSAVEVAAHGLSKSVPTLGERRERLLAWHNQLAVKREAYVDALVRDLGKPRCDAEGEVAYGLGILDLVARTPEDDEATEARQVRYRPHGIVGLITPWNNPFAIPVAKLAPALGYGNAALWKPALHGSGIAAMLRDSLEECGLGEYVALVTGDGSAGNAVSQAVDAISFTGSVPVGRRIIADAGRRGISVQAELGGSNAAIIDASADLDAAAEDLAAAIFSFAGQRCTAIRRVLVVAGVYDAFVERLVAAVEALRVGDPADATTQMGPVITRVEQDRFLALARDGKLLAGGNIPAGVDPAGCWLAPTLLADLPPGHPILTREIFGPVAAIVRIPDLKTAIAAHNATDLGLLGALFSASEGSKDLFLQDAQAGLLSINRARPPFAAEGPFIGWKASGYGVPEHGRWNRDFYTRAQAVYGK